MKKSKLPTPLPGTKKQRLVWQLLGEGLSRRAVAKHLGVSYATVRSHTTPAHMMRVGTHEPTPDWLTKELKS